MQVMDAYAYQTALRDRLARLASTGAVLGAMFGAISGVFGTAAAAAVFDLVNHPSLVPQALGWVLLAPVSAPVGAFVGFFLGALAGGITATLVRDPRAHTTHALATRVRIAIVIPTGAFALILLSSAVDTGDVAFGAAVAVLGAFAVGLGQFGARWLIRAAQR
jgi:hypothetical protein